MKDYEKLHQLNMVNKIHSFIESDSNPISILTPFVILRMVKKDGKISKFRNTKNSNCGERETITVELLGPVDTCSLASSLAWWLSETTTTGRQ